jgi:hypothetical protein
MASTLWQVFRQSVTPISVIQGEQAIQWGTGTFFRVDEASFLVTACHVWEDAVRCGYERDLFVFGIDGEVQMKPVPLKGNLHRAKDPADVAVFALDETTVSGLGESRFLRLNEVGLRPREPGWCFVFGFPVEPKKEVADLSPFKFNQLFLLAPLTLEGDGLDGYSRDYHFLLDASRDDLWLPDGTPGELPHRLNGISGCSVWQPELPQGNVVDNWKPDCTRIVGVQTSYYRKPSFIKVTHWAAVATVLYKSRPDLRRILEFHFGPAR